MLAVGAALGGLVAGTLGTTVFFVLDAVLLFGAAALTASTTRPFSPTADIMRRPPECAPCMLRDCPIDHRCMTRISVSDVFNVCKEILALD